MKRPFFVVATFLAALALEKRASAEVFWEDDFESAAVRWDCNFDCKIPGSNPGNTTDFPFHGAQSLKGTIMDGGVGGGGRILRSFTPSEEVWTRFYYRTHDFTPDSYVSAEHDLSGNGYPSFSWRTEAHTPWGREMQMRALNPAGDCGYGPYQACKYQPNMARIPLVNDHWYCIENHIKLNKAGDPNGTFEMWVADLSGAAGPQQTMGFYKELMRGPTPNGPGGNSSLLKLGTLQIYNAQGVGTRYHDLFAIGTTRIGCAKAPRVPDAGPSDEGGPPVPPANADVDAGAPSASSGGGEVSRAEPGGCNTTSASPLLGGGGVAVVFGLLVRRRRKLRSANAQKS